MEQLKTREEYDKEIMETEIRIRGLEKTIIKNLEIDVIYHLGDIHIPDNKERQEEYTKIINKTIEIIENDKRKKLVVICGDLFHDKTKPYQEANILARDLMQGIGDVSETIIIDGNHDVNMNNLGRTSSTEAILHHLNTKYKIHHLKENRIIKIQGINFGLTQMTNVKPTPTGARSLLELYIGLYHGTLYKSRTDEGYEFNDIGKIKGEDFMDYDIVMLGDIHKHQYLNKEKTIAYCGSLVQQNYGETINNHGMLLWDLKTLKSELIEIPNDYVFKTHLITDIKNYEIPDIENKLCRLKIIHKGIEKLELIEYEKNIRKKYEKNIIQLLKHEILEDNINNSNILGEEIINKNFMDIYREYLKKKNIKEDSDVSKILEKIIDEEQKKVSKEKKEIKLCELEFENILTYGPKNKILFEKLNDINILSGSNGIGKSSIIDIILWTIYNECSKGEGKDMLNIRYNKGYSILKLELNGEIYTIYRDIIKTKSNVLLLKGTVSKEEIHNKLKITEPKKNKSKKNLSLENTENTEDEESENNMNISNDGKRNIDTQIRTLFGEYEDMIMTSVILQTGKSFIDLKYAEQKTILTNILGLNLFENVRNTSSNTARKYTADILKKLERELMTMKLDYDNLIIECNNNLFHNEENLANKNQEYLNILKDENITEYKLNENANINYNDIIYKKNILISKQQELEISKSEINKDIEDIEDIEDTKNTLKINIEEMQTIINELTKEIRNTKNDNTKKLLNEKIQLENDICDINDNLKKLNENIILRESENTTILHSLSINENNLSMKKKEYESQKNNITKKLNEKEMLIKTINLQRENNKNLLNHKFSNTCECCENNKLIHTQIGYLEKINKLQQELELITYEKSNIVDIDEKISLLKNYEENIITINTEKLKIETFENKLKLITNNILSIDENIKIINKNIEINEKINGYQETFQHNKKKLDTIKKYQITLREYENNSIEILKYENTLSKYEENKEDITKLIEIKKQKKEIEEEIKKITQLINKITNDKLILEKEKLKRDNLSLEYKEHQKTTKIYTYITEMFQQGFMDYVMMKQLKILEIKMNNHINVLADYEIKILISNKNIVFYKIPKNQYLTDDKDIEKYINLKSLCGYERIIFNISLRLALNNMNVMIKNNFIIIDEGFSSADTFNIHKFPLVFETIKKEYDICILISHIEEIKNQKGNIIRIGYNEKTQDSNINIV